MIENVRQPPLSKGFLCALGGIGLTILSWYGPWEWPAWPALGAMALAFGSHTSFADLAYAARAAVVVATIIINVAAWGTALRGAWLLADKARRQARR